MKKTLQNKYRKNIAENIKLKNKIFESELKWKLPDFQSSYLTVPLRPLELPD